MSSQQNHSESPAKQFQSALVLLQQNAPLSAIAILERLAATYPNSIDTISLLGLSYYTANRPTEAIAWLQRGIALSPDNASLYRNLGPSLRALNRHSEAKLAYEKALQLNPKDAETANNLANLHRHLGNFQEAILYYKYALQIQENNPIYHYNLGGVYSESGDLLAAKNCFEKAIALKADYADAHNDLGKVYRHAGRLALAAACYQRAIEINPKHLHALNNLAGIYKTHGRAADAIDYYQRALAIRPDYADAFSNMLFAMQYSELVDVKQMFQTHLLFAQRFELKLKNLWREHQNVADPVRKLKIAYVSADFNHHAVAYFITPVLAHHDKTRVEVFAYYNGTRQDQFTEQTIAAVDHFKFVKPLSDEQFCEQIRTDQIDILIDLSGHTAGNRLLAFARKPAPIQITWLGYFGTTGLSAMDYRFTDVYMDPPGFADEIHSEKLLRLPHFSPFKPHANSPAVNTLPSLSKESFTFASMNNLAKLNQGVVALWSRILHAVPNSVLYLCNVGDAETERIVIEMFERYQIPSSRLLLQPWMPIERYLELHHEIDLALDPFPYNGGTITNHSLWMGVPVITLASNRSVGRIGASLMHRVGLAEFIAQSEDHYLQLAIEFAQQRDRLNQIRLGMRARLAENGEASIAKLTSSVEETYRKVWAKWCADKSSGCGV